LLLGNFYDRSCLPASDRSAGEVRVVIATGAAVKWPAAVMAGFEIPPVLPHDFGTVEELI